MTNRTIKNFEIKELIATGGMAAIYKAVQISLSRIVAVKILHGHLAQDKNFITRFEREAKAAANLKHENIVNIIDYGKADDIYFIAMEYVDGKSLKDLINEIKFVPSDIALGIGQQIVQGLDHAHRKGVVHRDIKPANILIGYDGIIKIADFGLAQAQDLTSVTVTGSIVGTPAYMSPEQAAGKKVDNRTDIFSLGVVIYEMLTGSKPFSGENYSSVIHEILTVTPPKPVEANPLIPREVNDIIEKMLEKEIEKRFQNIGEVNVAFSLYFKQKNIEVPHKKIGEFIRSPGKQFEDLIRVRKARHFERGLYFIEMGDARIDDAISEFSKVLHLDPNDAKAKRYLRQLKDKKKQQSKVELKEKKPDEIVFRKSPVPLISIAIGTILIFFFLFAFLKRINRKKESPEPVRVEQFAFLNIRSEPDSGAVYIDGKNSGRFTPVFIDKIEPGKHQVLIVKEGFLDYEQNVELQKNDTFNIYVLLKKPPAKIAFGSVQITSQPRGAEVYIDNKRTGFRTPCMIDRIEAGVHKIKVIKKGYQTQIVEHLVKAEQSSKVSFVLRKTEKPETAKKFSYLKVNVTPWAKIYVDNKYVETTPLATPIRITAGRHTIELRNPNYEIYKRQVNFKPGETKTLNIELKQPDGFLKLIVKPWADVYIDGRFYVTTPVAKPIKLSAGVHEIKLINPSYKKFEEKIVIPAGKMLKKNVELEAK